MLTCEGECAILVSRFFGVILSTHRLIFVNLWRQLNDSDRRNKKRAP